MGQYKMFFSKYNTCLDQIIYGDFSCCDYEFWDTNVQKSDIIRRYVEI